jgi:asparagine synthase (glutamine-hydrolysing)
VSGIFGLFKQDGAPVEPGELRDMASQLARRGPDRTGTWHAGGVGMGHTLLATTPEALRERLPLEHSESGCVITGDVRLDNRTELLSRLELPSVTGDGEIVLNAYLAWGEACVERFFGDFAFAIRDPRHDTLFCARDHMGMRPLYYHHTAGRFFAFASEPRALLVLPQTPYRINEGRIADFLIQHQMLEGIDKTSTFFEEVFRLPPAHTVTAAREGLRLTRYWRLEPEPELRLPTDDAYAEAFLEVFEEAVRCRLRTVGPPGVMLSGGMDSGTVAAVAREVLAMEGRGPLLTFSAVSPDGDAHPETRAIRASATMSGLEPHLVSYEDMDDLLQQLLRLTLEEHEPFDGHMTLVRTVYLCAHRAGLKTLLDGAGGDVVLSEGRRLARLLREGRWRTAYREAAGQNRFFKGGRPPRRELLLSARAAFFPDAMLRRLRPLHRKLSVGRVVRASMIDAEFARRVAVRERLRMLWSHDIGLLRDAGAERAHAIEHPFLTVGNERYDRVAAAVAMEPRDPFLDRRVAAFSVRLPGEQTLSGGWPKAILRRATAGRLPEEVRWRRGKEHLGWAFTQALWGNHRELIRDEVEVSLESLNGYVDAEARRRIRRCLFEEGELPSSEDIYNALYLGTWLRHHSSRPKGGVESGKERVHT